MPPHTHIRPSEEFIYENPKQEPARDDDDFLEEEAKTYGRENVGSVASPYIMPYIYKRRFLDTQYGTRNEGDVFKMDDSAVIVNTDGDITIKGKEIRWSDGLCELLPRKKVNKQHVTSDDLRTYKKILQMANAHLNGYQPGGAINVTGRRMFGQIIARRKGRGFESTLRCVWRKY